MVPNQDFEPVTAAELANQIALALPDYFHCQIVVEGAQIQFALSDGQRFTIAVAKQN